MRILNKREWPVQLRLKQLWPDNERLTWCYEQFGRENVNYTAHYVCFKREEDATYYTLRWGE